MIVGLLINNGPPRDLGTAMGFGLWLGTFATTSILLVTVGLTGLCERTSPVVLTKAIVAGLAALTGLLLYGLGLVSTPILAVIGVLLRRAIIGVQRFFGLRLAEGDSRSRHRPERKRGRKHNIETANGGTGGEKILAAEIPLHAAALTSHDHHLTSRSGRNQQLVVLPGAADSPPVAANSDLIQADLQVCSCRAEIHYGSR